MKFLIYCVFHTQKIGTLLCMIIALIACNAEVNPEWSRLVNILVICGVVAVGKFILGGYNATSVKGMVLAVILSTVTALAIIICGVKHGGGEVTFWKWGMPVIVAAICGCTAGYWVNELQNDDYADGVSADGILGSIFDNGLSDTINDFMGDVEAMLIYSCARGVAVYSNVLIIISVVIALAAN